MTAAGTPAQARTPMPSAALAGDPELTARELKDRIVAFVRGAAIALTPYDEPLLPQLADLLPMETDVYVVHPPLSKLEYVARTALAVRGYGWQAYPHLVARELTSEPQLRNALGELRAGGIDRILLTAGDRNSPAGPYVNTLDVLATGATVDCGITSIAFVAYPEGHRMIGPGLLWDALAAKQAFAARTGTRAHVVTQFGFHPRAVQEWVCHGRERGITLPVHAGLAGPALLPKLIRFAMRCGIGNSMHALTRSTSALTHQAPLTMTPEEMLVGLVHSRGDDAAIARPHFFCFGGCLETARWLLRVREGAFELTDDGTRFAVGA